MQGQHATVEQLSALLDDQLEEEEARAVRGHVETCAACEMQLAELRATLSLVRAVPAAAPPRSFRLPRATTDRRGVLRLPSWLLASPTVLRAFAGVAAALMLVLFFADASLQPVRQERSVSLSAPAPAASDTAPAAGQSNQESRGAVPAQRAPFAAGGSGPAASPAGEPQAPSATQALAAPPVSDAASTRARPAEGPGWWTPTRAAAVAAGVLAAGLLISSFLAGRRRRGSG